MPDLAGPQECRANAEQALADSDLQAAQVWALLAVAGELHETRRQQRKGV